MLLFKSFISTNENSYMRAFFEEPEIRCPICLGRVFTPVRPNCCTHVYCLYCLKKWNFTSKYALIYFVLKIKKLFQEDELCSNTEESINIYITKVLTK